MTDPQVIVNLGTGGSDLNGQNGSTSSADSNDARFLDWPGDNGGNYVYLPGVAGNFLSVPDEAALDITGDIDIRVLVAADNVASGTQTLLGKANTSTTRSYLFSIQSTGVLRFQWTEDGTTLAQQNSTVAPSWTDGEPLWLRVTLDADNGSGGADIAFYTSTNGATWTQLGSVITRASTITIFSSASGVQLGARQTTLDIFSAKFYRAQILDGIDGTLVLDVDTSVISSGSATSFTAVTGQTVTINRSTSGRKSVAVVSPVWLFGTDDFMEVADNALLNFDTDEAFSVVYAFRVWPTPGSFSSLLNKRLNTGDSFNIARIGYGSRILGTGSQFFQINSETHYKTATRSGLSAGLRVGVMRYNNKSLKHLLDGTEATETLDGGTTLRNSLPFRIGANSGAIAGDFGEFELYALALFRRELTDTERDAMVTYWTNRIK